MNAQSQSPSLADDELLGQIVDEFLERLHQGEQPDIEAYCANHPPLAQILRQVLPTLEMLHQVPLSLPQNPAPADKPAPLGTLGDFRLLREVGRGGMGIVYEAEQLSLNRRVALKVLPFAATMDPRHLQRFKNEALAAASLDHGNIVAVYGVGCERGVHYYAMRLIDGHTLAEIIAEMRQLRQKEAPLPRSVSVLLTRVQSATQEKASALSDDPTADYPPHAPDVAPATPPPGKVQPMSPRSTDTKPEIQAAVATSKVSDSPAWFRSVAELGLHVAEALEHAHQQGVIHRDIKPSNLMLDERGKIWITDFGLAHIETGATLTLTGDLIGTVRYMSPEQALAKRVLLDHRTDVYSLGATLYELLTLQPAFAGSDRQELLRQIAFEEPKAPRKVNRLIPADLETIVLKAMAKEPAERYATAQELADDLQRFLHDKPTKARKPSLLQRLRKLARRHRQVVTTVTIAVVVLLLGMVGILAWSNALITQEKNDKEAALQQARLNEELAEAERRRAKQNLLEAVRAVDQMLTRVSEERLRGIPQMTKVRRDLLQDALVFYEKFLEQKSDDPEMQLERALANNRVAYIYWFLSEYARAEAEYQKTLALLKQLAAQPKIGPRARAALIHCHLQFNATLGPDRKDEQLHHIRQAVAVAEALVTNFPDDRGYRNELAIASFRLADMLRSSQPEEAEKLLRRNFELTNNPYHLLHTYRSLGQYFASQGQHVEAEGAYRKALEQAQKMEPRSVRGHLAWTLEILADNLAAQGRHQDAEELFQEALALWQQLAADYPSMPRTRETLARNYLLLARTQKTLGKTAAAERAYRQAVALYDQLAQAFPALDAKYSFSQAALTNRLVLGKLLIESGRIEDAQQVYDEAAERSWQLTTDIPGRLDHWHGLVRTHLELAQALLAADKPAAAEAAFQKALTIQEKLQADFGGESKYLLELAQRHREAARQFQQAARPREAEKLYRLAMAGYTKLIADKTANKPEDRHELVRLHIELAGALLSVANSSAGEAAFQKALAIQEKLQADFGDQSEYLSELAQSHHQAAKRFRSASRPVQAQKLYGLAIAAYMRLIVEDPESEARCREKLGACYLELRKWHKAIEQYSRGIELQPDNWWLYHERGWCYLHLSQHQKVIEDYSKVIKWKPSNSGSWSRRGRAYLELGEVKKALDDFAKVLAGNENAESLNDMAWWIVASSNPRAHEPAPTSMAVTAAQKAVTLAPKAGHIWNTLGVAHYRAGDWKAAIEALTKAEEFQQGSHFGYNAFFLGMAHWQLDDKERARKWYQAALLWLASRTSVNAELKRFRAEAAALLDLPETLPQAEIQAKDRNVTLYTLVIELLPEAGWAWNRRGVAYSRLAQWNKALPDFTRFIELQPKNPTAWSNRAHTYNQLGQPDKAVTDAGKAIKLDSKYLFAWQVRGAAHAELGRYRQAADDLARVMELGQKGFRPLYELALLRLASGDKEGYQAACAELLKQFSDTKDLVTVEFMAWTCALAPEAVADTEVPLALAEKAVQANPSSAQHVNTLGAVLYRAGQLEKAVAKFQEADRLAQKADDTLSSPAYTWFFLAMAEQRLGRHKQARQWWEKAAAHTDKALTEHDAGANRLPWIRRLTLRLLRQEAEALIRPKEKHKE